MARRAWVSKQWFDESGKRRREKQSPGTRGTKPADEFVLDYYEPDGRRKFQKIPGRGSAAKRLADQRCDQVNRMLTTGTYYDSQNNVQWKAFRERYEVEHLGTMRSERSVETIQQTLDEFERICKPNLLSAINSEMIGRFVTSRLQQKIGKSDRTISAQTVNKDLRTLRAALNQAVAWEYLSRGPRIKMLKEFARDKPHVTVEEFLAMYDACEVATRPTTLQSRARNGRPVGEGGTLPYDPVDWWRALLVTAFNTGQRISDLLAIEWDRVDLKEGRWLSLAEDNKHKRDRWVDFDPEVGEHLKKIRQLVDPRVFPWPFGKGPLYDQFKLVQEHAGLDPSRTDFKFHAFRRAFVTFNWSLLGPEEVQRRAGHRSRATTEKYRVYVESRKKSELRAFLPDRLRTTEPEPATAKK